MTAFAPSRLVCGLIVMVAALGQSVALGQELAPTQRDVSASGHQVMILLDTNPHQKRVLAVELALAEGIVQKLQLPENVFSVITFGTQVPQLLRQVVAADEAIAAIRDVSIEQTNDKYFSVRSYDALNLAMNTFSTDTRSRALLIISEGNDHFPRKTFKETITRAQQLQVACDVAMVADHTLYGTKGLQRYGFHLRRLAAKTHGLYVEVGGNQKKVSGSIEELSRGIVSLTSARKF